ncbi:PH domain-containing protein [Flavobacterium cerinum]|uniref:PH domain-containing protein n=1 Tax=Flavobacterium cerinum TaxID=2502784 RepID=A0ABY5IVL4_9FLAO|nr:PH domain-containing protein [Flavobacterium cerinum]UUC46858.1 PH domain-containing protein [Flavobacterium cerinum]
MRVYKSKIDSGLVLLLVASLLGPSLVFLMKREWAGVLILLATIAFIFYLFLQTKYIVTNTMLQVKSGFLVNKKIAIQEIISIAKTDSIMSAPANSIMDRIEVRYKPNKSVIISPKEKQAFVEQLLAINPDIKITL